MTSDRKYSSHQNLEHIPNIVSQLIRTYETKYVNKNIPFVVFQMCALRSYDFLLRNPGKPCDAMRRLLELPVVFRNDKYLIRVRALLNAYTYCKCTTFFSLYSSLPHMDRVTLSHIIEHFRLRCVRNWCNAYKADVGLSMVRFAQLLCFESERSEDVKQFIEYYGQCSTWEVNELTHLDQKMLIRIGRTDKDKSNHLRWIPRDSLLREMEEVSLQRILEQTYFRRISADFLSAFDTFNNENSNSPLGKAYEPFCLIHVSKLHSYLLPQEKVKRIVLKSEEVTRLKQQASACMNFKNWRVSKMESKIIEMKNSEYRQELKTETDSMTELLNEKRVQIDKYKDRIRGLPVSTLPLNLDLPLRVGG